MQIQNHHKETSAFNLKSQDTKAFERLNRLNSEVSERAPFEATKLKTNITNSETRSTVNNFSFQRDQLSEVSNLLGIQLNPVETHDEASYFDTHGWLCGTKVARECKFKMWKWMYESQSKSIIATLRSQLNVKELHKVYSKKTYLHPFLAAYFLTTINYDDSYRNTIDQLFVEVKRHVTKILGNPEEGSAQSSVDSLSVEKPNIDSSYLVQIKQRIESADFDRGLRRAAYALDLSQGDFINWLSIHGYIIVDEVRAIGKTGECDYKWKPSKEMVRLGYMIICKTPPTRMGITQEQTLITPKGMLGFFDELADEKVLG
jgi:hypothetical protein